MNQKSKYKRIHQRVERLARKATETGEMTREDLSLFLLLRRKLQ